MCSIRILLLLFSLTNSPSVLFSLSSCSSRAPFSFPLLSRALPAPLPLPSARLALLRSPFLFTLFSEPLFSCFSLSSSPLLSFPLLSWPVSCSSPRRWSPLLLCSLTSLSSSSPTRFPAPLQPTSLWGLVHSAILSATSESLSFSSLCCPHLCCCSSSVPSSSCSGTAMAWFYEPPAPMLGATWTRSSSSSSPL